MNLYQVNLSLSTCSNLSSLHHLFFLTTVYIDTILHQFQMYGKVARKPTLYRVVPLPPQAPTGPRPLP